MILYHSTTKEYADSILRAGFKDSEGSYASGEWWSGVWLADRPLDAGEIHCPVVAVLQVTLNLTEEQLDEYEWKAEAIHIPGEGWITDDDGKGYREWLLPAALINGHSLVDRLPDTIFTEE